MMKHNIATRILPTLAAAALLLASCIEDTGNHITQILYPYGSEISYGYGLVYADQTLDSIIYQTTEAHRVVPAVGWIEIDDASIRDIAYRDNSIYLLSLPVKFKPNTTGETRFGEVTVRAGEYSAATGFLQTRFLNIQRPYRYVGAGLATDSLVTVTDSAMVSTDSIVFTAYSDWTLTPKHGSWLLLEKTEGKSGSHTVRFQLTPNTTTVNRTDTIMLRSNGVEEGIPVLQLAEVYLKN